MDNEAAVIRAEMSRTRKDLDHKLERLENRARELSPRQLAKRHLPDRMLDRTLGSFLTLIGLKMAWGQYRLRHRRDRVHSALMAYGRR